MLHQVRRPWVVNRASFSEVLIRRYQESDVPLICITPKDALFQDIPMQRIQCDFSPTHLASATFRQPL